MTKNTNRLIQFWKELGRRKVIHIFFAYLATSYSIIEFFDITSNRFSIPDNTFNLLYILAAIGVPLAVILPWIINRKKEELIAEDQVLSEIITESKRKKPLHNLPVQVTNFIGREKETGELRVLVENSRLVTITGEGGCGKTRISLQIAKEYLDKFNDGVWFVDLSPTGGS